jgi:hypothetical protein
VGGSHQHEGLQMRKPKKPVETVARSHLMAVAERLVEDGVKKAIICFMDDEGGVGYTISAETSIPEAVFLMRQAEVMLLTQPPEEEEYEEY